MVADEIMPAERMDFEDNTFSQVDCIQVLEHLGAARSIYALSEMYRVLTPGGVLHLETPDLVSSFKAFVKGNVEKRKLLMNWIYGLDSPGMSHRYGFPEELLRLVLQETGFEEIEIDHIDCDSVNPTLRTSCRKGNSLIHQSLSRFRKKLVNQKWVDLEQQVEVLDIETLIQELLESLPVSSHALEEEHLKHITRTSINCPRIGQAFIETIVDSRFSMAADAQMYIDLLQELEQVGFPRILVYLFMEMPINPGTQRDTFQSVRSMAYTIIGKMIRGDEDVRKHLVSTASQLNDWSEMSHFSESVLQSLSEKKLALGIKAFALDRMKDAEENLFDAIRLNRDSVLAYWNIARVYALQKLVDRSLLYYQSLKKLITIQYLKQSRKYLRNIENEIQAIRKGELKIVSMPIHFIR
jgi:SAM-dependent methyltransferase